MYKSSKKKVYPDEFSVSPLPKVWITAYDVFSTTLAVESQVDTILVGDSLGMTVYGFPDTTCVDTEIMKRHFTAVKNHANGIPIVLDYPFGCADSLERGKRTFEDFYSLGASSVKIEGGKELVPLFQWIHKNGGKGVGHLGLQPQISQTRVHGKNSTEAQEILETIQLFQTAGVETIVLECVPESLGQQAQEIFSGDIIGIGAGRYTNGQVLVFDDIVGKTKKDFTPRFLHRFGDALSTESKAIQEYTQAVRLQQFPQKKHTY